MFVATLGIGATQAQTVEKVETQPAKAEQKANEISPRKMEQHPKAAIEKKSLIIEPKAHQAVGKKGSKAEKAVGNVKPMEYKEPTKVNHAVKAEKSAAKAETNKAKSVTNGDKLTGEKHNGHPVYEGPKGGDIILTQAEIKSILNKSD
ncbi:MULTISPECIES: hypothetical protein [Sphingobacterium]|uniref:hypothetical protein n=1 Tax=Sphingobacterium TaxID=28453 RepID=UPI001F09AB95|nr:MULTISPECIES: hypothetical protein [unclassified Sphingobacterium]